MKCKVCNGEITDSSAVSCPFCGSPVQMETNLFDTSVIPLTPTNPVLPSDQGMNLNSQTNVINLSGVNSSMEGGISLSADSGSNNILSNENIVNTEVVSENVVPVVNNEVVSENVVPVVNNEVVSENVAPVVNTEVVSENVTPVVNTEVVSENVTPVVNTGIPMDNVSPTGTPQLSSNLVVEGEKKNKKGLIIGIIAAVFVVLIGVIYYFEFQTANSRVEKNLSFISDKLSAIKVEINNAIKGSLTFDGKVTASGSTIAGKINADYGVDFDKKILDYNIKVSEINLAGKKFKDSITADLYVKDDTANISIPELYSKYISVQDEKISEIFNITATQDYDIVSLSKSFERAIVEGFKSLDKKQSVKNVEVNGKKEMSNVIEADLNEQNVNNFKNAFIDTLLNDENFIKEFAKISSEDENSIKESLKESREEKTTVSKKMNLQIVTGLVDGAFKKLSMKNDEGSLVLELIDDKEFKVNFDSDDTKFDFAIKSDVSFKENTSDNKIEFVANITSEGSTTSLEFTITTKEEKNATVEEKNVSSISVDRMTQYDLNTIQRNMEKNDILSFVLNTVMTTNTNKNQVIIEDDTNLENEFSFVDEDDIDDIDDIIFEDDSEEDNFGFDIE